MANPIRRLVQLVLDKGAAVRAEAGAKTSLSGMQRSINAVKSAALALGVALGAAFVTRKIVQFGKDAVRTANEANAIWTRLAGTINNAGGSFDALRPRITEVARAMQDATTVGDEQFAEVLQNLISTSQDVERSIGAVSVVADLAAAKNLELGTAAQLVGRAMVGQTGTLSRYGIVVAEGADAVEVLREQFKGMAANEAATLQGKIKQLNNEWSDFKEAVGNAIIEAASGTSIIEVLTATVKDAAIWVDRNREAFGSVALVLGVLIRVLGTTLDGYVRLARFVSSGFTFAFSGLIRIVAGVADGLALAAIAGEKLNAILGRREVSQQWAEAAENLRRKAQELRQMADDAVEAAQLLRDEATTPRAPRATVARPAGGPTTTISTRAGREAPVAVDPTAATELKRLESEALSITQSLRLPAEVYADTLRVLQAHRDADRISEETYVRAKKEAQRVFEEATASADKEAEALNRVDQALKDHANTVAAAATLQGVLGKEVNALAEEESSLLATLRVLADEGIPATDERFAHLVDRLQGVRQGLQATQTELDITGSVAETVGALVGASFGGGIGALASAKARQNAVLAAEQLAHGFAALLNPFTAATAGGYFAAAAKYTAVAGAWKALSRAAGGGGGGGGGSMFGASGVGRDVGGPSTSRMTGSGGPEVHIHFVGEGFDAVNPQVQRVVAGAQQMVLERYGPNARVRIHRRTTG
jgi:hypothetical protein